MNAINRLLVAALVSAGFAATAQGAAVDDSVPPATPVIDLTLPDDGYPLDVEMVVRNWVVCASAASAEEIVNARVRGPDQAREAYAALAGAKSCGAFGELRVILQKAVYASSTDAGYDARIFGALINFSGAWAAGYLVTGGLAE